MFETAYRPLTDGYKQKDLLGIPWRVAFALQADGWYLRSDIIWHKPNPMPESVTDRPTKSHEYVFLLAKQERYYYDAAAIMEVGAGRLDFGDMNISARLDSGAPWQNGEKTTVGRNKRTVWTIATEPYEGAHFATMPEALIEPCILAGCPVGGLVLDPFLGSGTVGAVAERLGRRWVGCDLVYHDLAKERTAQRGLRW
jgi:DNA modification methylase